MTHQKWHTAFTVKWIKYFILLEQKGNSASVINQACAPEVLTLCVIQQLGVVWEPEICFDEILTRITHIMKQSSVFTGIKEQQPHIKNIKNDLWHTKWKRIDFKQRHVTLRLGQTGPCWSQAWAKNLITSANAWLWHSEYWPCRSLQKQTGSVHPGRRSRSYWRRSLWFYHSLSSSLVPAFPDHLRKKKRGTLEVKSSIFFC